MDINVLLRIRKKDAFPWAISFKTTKSKSMSTGISSCIRIKESFSMVEEVGTKKAHNIISTDICVMKNIKNYYVLPNFQY